MAAENSFDIACKVDMQEVANAVNQAKREVETRYDLKGSKNEIAEEKMDLVLTSADIGHTIRVQVLAGHSSNREMLLRASCSAFVRCDIRVEEEGLSVGYAATVLGRLPGVRRLSPRGR